MEMLKALIIMWHQNHLSKVCLADREYDELSHAASKAQDALKENLSDEAYKQVIDALDMVTAADMRNVYLAYQEGLKGGIRLIIEALM